MFLKDMDANSMVLAALATAVASGAGVAGSIYYSWRKGRHIFRHLAGIKVRLDELEQVRIAKLSDAVAKLEILGEIDARRGKDLPTDPSVPSRFTAQFGEDIVIYEFFKDSPPGFFVEAGAYDGEFASNTWLLESLGWRGLLVEPHPRMASLCREKRPGSVVVQAALGPMDAHGEVEFTCADAEGGGAALSYLKADPNHIERCLGEGCELTKVSVPFVSLVSLLEAHTDKVDLLSLDIEGEELAALQGMDLERYAPRMIIVERQADERDMAVDRLLAESGYRLLKTRGCNAIYVSGE